jgi:hypothetical protein
MPGELDAITEYGVYGATWIEGCLMAVIIAPENIPSDKWFVSLLETFSDQLPFSIVQRFLDIISLRADGVSALLGQKGAVERRMLQYDLGDMQEWAAGFEAGYEWFKEFWPEAALSEADRAGLRQIVGGADAEFAKPCIRDLGVWLEARHLETTSLG